MSRGIYNPVADEGVYAIGRVFTRDFKWAFRTPSTADLGIDAHVEICSQGQPTGRFLFLQIKAGVSYFREEANNGFVYRSSVRHLRYWLNLPVPLVLLIYNPESEQILWQVVTPSTVESTGKGWKIVVPKAQLLNKGALPTLLSLVEGVDESGIGAEAETIIQQRMPIPEIDPSTSMVIEESELVNMLDSYLQSVKVDVRDQVTRLWACALSLSEWQTSMMKIIKLCIVTNYAIATGGFNNLDIADLQKRLHALIFQQFRSLAAFANELAQGIYLEDELEHVINRAELYIDSSRVAFDIGRSHEPGLYYLGNDEIGWTVKGKTVRDNSKR